MQQIYFLFAFLMVASTCAATELLPWFGNEYEFEIRISCLYQNYDSLATSARHKHIGRANDFFMTASATYPFKRYCGEFEATAAHTQHQNCRWDNFRFTGRYLWLDQMRGDKYNLVLGFTLTEPFSRALHDISSFHSGHIECEMNFAFGKKYGPLCSKNFLFRWWNVTCVGIADVGRPWYRENIACEYNYQGVHRLRGFLNTLWGTGGKKLKPRHFKGYGKVNHQSVDIGFRYGYNLGCMGILSLEYTRRVYANNFPQNVNLVYLEYYFPFGTQSFFNY